MYGEDVRTVAVAGSYMAVGLNNVPVVNVVCRGVLAGCKGVVEGSRDGLEGCRGEFTGCIGVGRGGEGLWGVRDEGWE